MGEANKSTSTAEEDLLLKSFFAEVSEVERDNEVIRSPSLPFSVFFLSPKHRLSVLYLGCMLLISELNSIRVCWVLAMFLVLYLKVDESDIVSELFGYA